ncbi:MAG TPA: extracellular solute-binding protein [Beijerinckiaceae bacterium]|jgi:iron(III) transport system substrate-binding protein
MGSKRLLRAALAALLGPVFALGALALPAATPVTAELVAAAEREGAVNFYTSVDVEVAERVKKAFEAKYPRIKVMVERNGAQRQFQRLSQEYASRIFNADVVNSADAAHFVVWKRQGWLAPFVPEDVARHYAPEHVDPDGLFATWKASLCVAGYNTRFVKATDAPRSYADLLDPKWRGLIVKAHPSYSGTILTETSVVARELGWGFFERLGRQKVMQVQSSTESPKKLAVGERPVMADGTESNMFTLKEAGAPVEIVYPAEGTPFVPSPTAVLAKAPHPNAARLFQAFLYSPELQQLLIDEGGERSLHPLAKERPGRRPLATIKLLTEDPAVIADRAEEIKANYTKYFGT